MIIDPKADPALVPALEATIARGETFGNECKRRGAKFLPLQVMRPIYKEAGLPVGPMFKSCTNDFLVLNFSANNKEKTL